MKSLEVRAKNIEQQIELRLNQPIILRKFIQQLGKVNLDAHTISLVLSKDVSKRKSSRRKRRKKLYGSNQVTHAISWVYYSSSFL